MRCEHAIPPDVEPCELEVIQECLALFDDPRVRIVDRSKGESFTIYVNGAFLPDEPPFSPSATESAGVFSEKRYRSIVLEATIQAKLLRRGWIVSHWPVPKRPVYRTVRKSESTECLAVWPHRTTSGPVTYHKITARTVRSAQADSVMANDALAASRDLSKSDRKRRFELARRLGVDGLESNPVMQYLAAKDDYTMEHSLRVAGYIDVLARDFGDRTGVFSNEFEYGNIRRTGLLHDLGKLAAPTMALGKKTDLSPREKYWIDRHVLLAGGFSVLSEGVGLHLDLIPVLSHHLRPRDVSAVSQMYFGDAYQPGDADVIKSACVTALLKLSDALDSMTSLRPYRPTGRNRKGPMTVEEALAKLTSDCANDDPDYYHGIPFPVPLRADLVEAAKAMLGSRHVFDAAQAIRLRYPAPFADLQIT